MIRCVCKLVFLVFLCAVAAYALYLMREADKAEKGTGSVTTSIIVDSSAANNSLLIERGNEAVGSESVVILF